jgi:hypothetical protein
LQDLPTALKHAAEMLTMLCPHLSDAAAGCHVIDT